MFGLSAVQAQPQLRAQSRALLAGSGQPRVCRGPNLINNAGNRAALAAEPCRTGGDKGQHRDTQWELGKEQNPDIR